MKRVVLCRTAGPRNAGMALRAAANFGPVELVLVAPAKRSLLIHPDFEQMSHGVEDQASRVRVVDTLEDALADVTWSVGFTARARGHRALRDWNDLAPEIAERASAERVALVFGNEEHGLTKPETELVQELAHIATSDEHTSLNLAMAVTVVLCSLFGARSTKAARTPGSPLVGAKREFLKAHVADTLGAAATSPQVRLEIMASARRVFAHAPLETRDAGAWHAVMRALGNAKTPEDYGLSIDPD